MRTIDTRAGPPPPPEEREESTAALTVEDAELRAMLARAGAKLARLREIHHMTQRDVQKATGGRLLAQQLSRLETGQVERPSAYDLALLATLYGLTPNAMLSDVFHYWEPRPGQDNEQPPEDPRVRRMKQVARTLPEHKREKLYNSVEIATVLVETES